MMQIPVERPSDQKPRGSWLSILMALMLGLGLISALFFLPLVWIGPVLIGGGMFFVALFHYLVWGWWLSDIIRREDAADSDDRAA
jgi:hypothetical protein